MIDCTRDLYSGLVILCEGEEPGIGDIGIGIGIGIDVGIGFSPGFLLFQNWCCVAHCRSFHFVLSLLLLSLQCV